MLVFGVCSGNAGACVLFIFDLLTSRAADHLKMPIEMKPVTYRGACLSTPLFLWRKDVSRLRPGRRVATFRGVP